MSVITKGRTFQDGEQLTAEKLNVLVDGAEFSSAAVDNSTTRLSSGGAITVKPEGITSNELAPSERWQNAYPVGSIYMNASNSDNPSTLLGFGTWVSFGAGRVLVGIDGNQSEFNQLGETGGSKNVRLTAAQSGLPAHSHSTTSIASYTDHGNGNYPDGGVAVYNNTTQTWNRVTVNNNTARNASQSHTNLQPYIVVYMWKRTA
jgi:hypothetical protein